MIRILTLLLFSLPLQAKVSDELKKAGLLKEIVLPYANMKEPIFRNVTIIWFVY